MTERRKIALVTGSSRGLGKNMAMSLAHAGLDVILTYNQKKEEANKVVQEIKNINRKCIALQLSVNDTKTFQNFKQTLSEQLKVNWGEDKFDFLINNAGFGINKPLTDISEDEFDQLLGVHYKGVFFLTQKLLPIMNDGGGVVNLSTGLTRFCIPGYGAYAAMKGAIEIFTKYLAKEVGARKIRVNLVAPGAIDTDFNKEALEHHPELKNFIASQTALGRMGAADDIGGVVAFLCSENAKWVNAQRVEASGGMFL